MPTTVALSDIVQKMANEDSSATLGWDVVVSYSETEINALLSSSYTNNPSEHVKELTLSVTGTDEDDNPYTISFKFELGSPLIRFVGSGIRPSCTLTIPVNGGQASTTSKTDTIPAGAYQIELSNLEMATMTGSAEGTTGLTASDHAFVFPSSGSGTAFVTVDLRGSKEMVCKLNSVQGVTGINRVDLRKDSIQGQLFTYFTNDATASSIRYQLASVDPTQPPTGYVTLHPKSFRFAAYHSEAHTTTILSLFIQTADTQSGTVEDLQLKWLGRWVDTYGVPPIPDSHTTSIIFNATMMHNTLLVPALENSSIGTSAPTFIKGKGLQYQLLTHRKAERAATGSTTYSWVGGYSVDLDADNNQLYVTLGQNEKYDSPAQCVMKWHFQYKFDWSRVQRTGHASVKYTGNCTVTNNLDVSRGLSDTLTDDKLQMNLNISSGDWDKPTYTATATDWTSIIANAFGLKSDDWFATNLPTMSGMNIDLGNLYFFLTTNLLLPGQKVISVDATSTGGLRIPNDYYIVGTVVTHSSA